MSAGDRRNSAAGLAAAAVAMLLLAGCAPPSQRIATSLGDLGVAPGQARCMGDRLGQRLSIGQLRRLQDLNRIRQDGRLGRMTIGEIAQQLTDDRDPALIAEFVRAGIGCAM